MYYFYLLVFVFSALPLFSQEAGFGSKNKDQAILIAASYGPEIPAADLADRFGSNFGAGVDLGFTPSRSPWTFTLQGKFLFGNEVKDDVLEGLRVDGGFIIGTMRLPADIQLRMRGLYVGVRAGRIFSLGKNPRAGFKIGLGAGWLSNRIRVQFDPMQTVNQLVGDYRQGYDRLVAGPALTNYIGWYQLGKAGRINFFAGLETTVGFTTNQRDFDFATAGTFEESRVDVSLGLRAGIILPLYLGEGEDIFYR
ncbi:MAG: hypothetical protein AAF741_12355 [Bacteroidota bacterium]